MTLGAMQRVIPVAVLTSLPSFTDAIKCRFRTVSNNNTSYSEHWFYCATECCGDRCCPAKSYLYDTQVTERLAAAFAWVFIAVSVVIVLSWTNLFEHVAAIWRRWTQTRETISWTSVENSPRDLPGYDIPGRIPNPNTQGPVPITSSMTGPGKHAAPTGKTSRYPSNNDMSAPLTSPPSYATVMGQLETEITNPGPSINTGIPSDGLTVDPGNSETAYGDRSKLL